MDSVKREEIIFKSAEGLFNISKEILPINKELSNTILYLSDRILKEIETSTESTQVEVPGTANIAPKPVMLTPEQIKAKHMETCPDCGGYKEPIPHNAETCPDCGGVKAGHVHVHGENCPDCGGVKEVKPMEFSNSFVEEDKSTMCNGHTGDGSGGNPTKDQPVKAPAQHNPKQSSKVQSEVKDLIEELRKGLQ